ncbi:MAG: hypothetical protein ACREIA_01565 [Opitutaceae bacterium]
MFDRLPWHAIDSEFESRIPFDSPHESRDYLQRLVNSGIATRHRLVKESETVGIVITHVETGSLGRELVCIAAYSDSRAPLTDELFEAMELLARAERCVSIRFHTVRAALVRRAAEDMGYRVSEIVMRKNVE